MEVTRIFDLLQNLKLNYPKEDALARKVNNTWKKYSTDEYINFSNRLSYGLMAKNLVAGDKIATVTNNRPEWNIVDMALSQAGFIHVPVYPTISENEYKHVLGHSEVKAVFVGTKTLYNKISGVLSELNLTKNTYIFDEVEDTQNWNQLIKLGHDNESKYKESLEVIKSTITPDDVTTIIYTSGTTGVSKGVMLTHNNFVSNFKGAVPVFPLNQQHKALSFLPLCHVYERLLNYLFQYRGVSIYYAENMGKIKDNLIELKADGFNTVPRLLEKIHDALVGRGKELPWIKKIVFFGALEMAYNFSFEKKQHFIYKHLYKLADKLVYSKWREAFGNNIKFIGCGGAALQERLIRMFWAAGFPIQEGYGLTETSPLIAINHNTPKNIKFGTVGLPLQGVEVKIADDGEILCKGPNVMKGYFKNEAFTNEVIKDGWFHTGDIGVLDEEGFLKITDRKKEIFKTSSGKYISPQSIENKLKESFLIEQAMVIGENQKFASALIVPDFKMLHSWSSIKGIAYSNNKELVNHSKVFERVQREVEVVNKTLGSPEKIKRIRLICEEWSPSTGEMSPTLKLKRKVIYKKYAHIIDEIYKLSKQA